MPRIGHHRLEATEQAPHHARSLVGRELEEVATLEERELAQLLISELVTNALQHTESDVILIDIGFDVRTRVSVTDRSPRLPQRRSPRHDDEEGRGLVIIDALAERWGVDAIPGNGKRIWFELPAHE